ncbi:MAG: NAD(P)H-hydrate dehydratase [Calditrichaeota bacterium]|nr:NAD(P)H-hydrate dehydratase [Calditrichota bacterium]
MPIPLLSSAQAELLDQYTIDEIGISGRQLMRNAGNETFKQLKKEIKKTDKIIIVCGSGNNGGDGFVIADNFVKNGFRVDLYHTKAIENCSPDSVFYAEKLRKKGFKNFYLISEATIRQINDCDLLIDALLGTGFTGQLKPLYKHLLDHLNQLKCKRLAVDVPSGLDATTGSGSDAFNADITITMGNAKCGFYVNDGPYKCGDIRVVDIGFPKKIDSIVGETVRLNTAADIKILLPKRKIDSHKTTFGKVAVIGGSLSMSGSVLLASIAALKAGAGLVKTAVPAEIFSSVDGKQAELMVVPLENQSGVDELIDWADVVVIGMGMGKSEFAKAVLGNVIKNCRKRMVIDADAINLLDTDLLEKLNGKEYVLTPHLGEFSRLNGKSIAEIKQDIYTCLREFSIRYRSAVLLKGKTTVIADGSGKIAIDTSGNSALATAGTGDVLSGLIGGFAAQGLSCLDATMLATYLHGTAAEIGSIETTEYSFIASDIVRFLPDAIRTLI